MLTTIILSDLSEEGDERCLVPDDSSPNAFSSCTFSRGSESPPRSLPLDLSVSLDLVKIMSLYTGANHLHTPPCDFFRDRRTPDSVLSCVRFDVFEEFRRRRNTPVRNGGSCCERK
ncbi:hypothetical protein NECAME_14780 [Necator americanus]|uniref:Uncharacterized protein n=1 Tax=Necator americanus TaxID=51031 RepID=W2SL78_NECAM|nr:hypothetical protein NECAME_14780 [Necator americanus]ETN70424.1 hypothetical protein NECAME_14780 [Necator americanus]